MPDDLYIVTNGEGYAFQDDEGIHLHTSEVIPDFVKWIRDEHTEGANIDIAVYKLELVGSDDEGTLKL